MLPSSANRTQEIAIAVGLLFAAARIGVAADVDPNNAAVQQAYVGPVTQQKLDAALAGLLNVARQPASVVPCGFCGGSAGSFVWIYQAGGNSFLVGGLPPTVLTTIQAANDSALGAPGAAVTLNNALLRTLASFSTARDFTIGAGGAVIDTNGFVFSIGGTVTINGPLVKDGAGTLVLTGNNVWHDTVYVDNGVLEGNSASLQTSIVSNGTVRFNQPFDGSYAASLSVNPSGSFEKTGAGKLTIGGANSFGAMTTVAEGTLALQGASHDIRALNIGSTAAFDITGAAATTAIGSLSGAGAVMLGPNRLVVNSSSDSTFSGTISGTGGITKDGSGTLTLTAAQLFTGPTGITGGTLALAGQGRLNPMSSVFISGKLDISSSNGAQEVGSIGGDGQIALGANTLTVGGANLPNSFSGSISGTGGLTKIGTGQLDLTGSSTYTGTTSIAQGTLFAKTSSISNAVVNNATLVLTEDKADPPFLSAYSGNISGSGRLVKEGEGLIWLRGANTFSGGTIVNSGVLIGNTDSLQGSISNNANLAFYQVTDGTYSGNITGAGNVYVYGPGMLSFGSAAGIGGNLVNGGHIARSGALGTLAVAGNVFFAPGSSFRVRVDAAGNNDRIAATGSGSVALLQGGNVDVQAANGDYRMGTRYNILSAAGGVSGQFASVSSNLPFLTPSLGYDSNNALLTLARNDVSFSSIALTANQSATGQLLTRLQNGASGDMAVVLNSFSALSANDARAALDLIAGAGRAGLARLNAFDLRAVNQNVGARLGWVDSGGGVASGAGVGSGGIKLAYEESMRSDVPVQYAQAIGAHAGSAFDGNSKYGFWLRGFGGSGHIDGDAESAGYSYRLGGVIAGYDCALSEALTLGVLAAYSEPTLDQDNPVGHTRTKSYRAGLYGRYRVGAGYVDGIVSYAGNVSDTSRSVTVGVLNRTATASFNGSTTSAQLEAGYTIKGRVDLIPMAGLQWARQYQDDYTEEGAGALNLVVSGNTLDSLRSILGTRALYEFDSGGKRMALEARAGWAHEFRDQGVLSARLAGDPVGASFRVTGIAIPRDSAVLGAGFAVEAKRSLRMYVDLSAELNGVQRTYGASAGLRYQW